MVFDFVSVGILVILVLVFGFLAFRTWRVKNMLLRIVGGILFSLLTLLPLLVLVVAILGFAKINKTYDYPVSNIKVQGTPEQIARGTKFANLCAGCHSSTSKPPLNGRDFAA